MSPDSADQITAELAVSNHANWFQAAVYGLVLVLSRAGCLGAEPQAEAPFTVVILPDTQIYSKPPGAVLR
jgi:hypothetical protein